jgi:hypothetical protein
MLTGFSFALSIKIKIRLTDNFDPMERRVTQDGFNKT